MSKSEWFRDYERQWEQRQARIEHSMDDTDRVLSWPQVAWAFALAPFRVLWYLWKGVM